MTAVIGNESEVEVVVYKHPEAGVRAFLNRTVAAQLHVFGGLAAIVGLVVLLKAANHQSNSSHFWACLVFGLSSVFLFAASSLCHFVADGFVPTARVDQALEDLDHVAIYFFIAGSYTPFLLNAIESPWRWILMAAIWAMAAAGVAYTLFRTSLPAWTRHRYANVGLFLLMGWVLLARCGEAFERLTDGQTALLLLGGVSYSVGALIYAGRKPNPFPGTFGFHEIWHCLVLLGYASHYAMIVRFYA